MVEALYREDPEGANHGPCRHLWRGDALSQSGRSGGYAGRTGRCRQDARNAGERFHDEGWPDSPRRSACPRHVSVPRQVAGGVQIQVRLLPAARDNSRKRSLQTDGGRWMSALEESVIEGVVPIARNRIDEIIAGRFACREFSDTPVPRRTIEQILSVARFAPSGANIQPWHVHVLAGAVKDKVSAALLEAHATSRHEHESEYKYYAADLPEPYLNRRQEFGRLFYGSLGIAQTDVEARSRQTARNYAFFGAPVGLIVTIDRRLEVGSWLDLGMFVQNV